MEKYNESDKEKLGEIIDSVEHVLIEKNTRYGNAALSPINVFYKGDAKNSIQIRMDDKISRIINSNILRKNDLFDLLGYLYLYMMLFMPNDKKYTSYSFNDKVKLITDCIVSDILNVNKDRKKSIDKKTLLSDFDKIKKHEFGSGLTLEFDLIDDIVNYFIENNITDFSELID